MSNYKQSTNKKSKPFERMAYYSDRRTSKCLLYFLMSKIKFNFLTTNVPPLISNQGEINYLHFKADQRNLC